MAQPHHHYHHHLGTLNARFPINITLSHWPMITWQFGKDNISMLKQAVTQRMIITILLKTKRTSNPMISVQFNSIQFDSIKFIRFDSLDSILSTQFIRLISMLFIEICWSPPSYLPSLPLPDPSCIISTVLTSSWGSTVIRFRTTILGMITIITRYSPPPRRHRLLHPVLHIWLTNLLWSRKRWCWREIQSMPVDRWKTK